VLDIKEEFRESVASVLKAECDNLSLRAHVDGENDLDLSLWQHATQLGWLSVMIKEEFDGLGQDFSMIPVFHREFGHYLAPGDFISIHTFIAMLQAINDADFCKQYLPELAAGHIKPLVPVTDDHIALELKNGLLQGISGPLLGPAGASIAAVRATAENGDPTIAIVDTKTPGCTIKAMPVLDQTRRRLCTAQCSEEQPLIVLQDDLFTRANSALHTSARLATASDSIGVGYRALQSTVAYLSERQQFGQPIGRFQATGFKLADMAVELRAADLLVMHTVGKAERGAMTDADAAMVKLYCSEMLGRVADHTVQIHGGMGLMEEVPVQRLWRDARLERIWDGTSEIQRHIIGRDLLRPLGA